MSRDSPPHNQNTAKVVAILAGFAVIFLGIAFVATRGSRTAETASSDGASDNRAACQFNSNFFGLIAENAWEHECMEEGEVIIAVDGLPGVDGIWSSVEDRMALEGWSLDEGASTQPIGRCFIDSKNVYKTKAVVSGTLTESKDAEGNVIPSLNVLTTIDVGVTGGGPYAAVVREVSTATQTDPEEDDFSAVGAWVVTHNYLAGSGTVVATPLRETEDWKGLVVFKPGKGAQMYNDREFSPWTDTQYLGTPNYDFTIVLACK